MNTERIRELITDNDAMYLARRRDELEYIGGGCFGSAYRLRDGTVLKKGHCIDGTALWIMQAAKVYRDTGKPPEFAPKVYAFEATEGGVWWARMEWVTSERARNGPSWADDAPQKMRKHLQEWGDSIGLNRYDGDYAYPDSHSANWGYTKSGRMVCFDPFAGSQEHSTFNVYPAPKALPKHLQVRHAGPTRGRWARG